MEGVVIASCLVAFVLYSNTLDAEFAYDDSRAIKTNPDVLPSTPLTSLLSHDFWGTPLTHSGSHKSYRPVTVLSFRLNYLIGELEPSIYHLTNVVLHSFATWLFTVFSRHVAPDTRVTKGLAPLLFAVHPVHTEAVAGVVGRADVGATIFFLGSLLSYIKYCGVKPTTRRALPNHVGSRRWGWLVMSLVCAALSMLTKEYGVTVLAVCAFYHVFLHAKLGIKDCIFIFTERRHRSVVEGLCYLGLTLLVLLAFRFSIMGSQPPEFAPADNPAADNESTIVRTLTFLFLPAFNAWLLLCPSTLSFDWSMEAIPLVTSLWDVRNIASLLFYGTFSALIGTIMMKKSRCEPSYIKERLRECNGDRTRNKRRYTGQRHCVEVVALSLVLLTFPFVPATNLFFYVGFVVAERILYLPSMGWCLLVAWGADILHSRTQSSKVKRLHVVATFLLLLIFSLRTWRRNHDWSTEENLYKSGINVNPPKAYGNLANILSSQDKKDQAEWAYKEALSYRSNMADVHYNLGILLQEQKRYEEALSEYKLAIQFRPRMAMAHLNMGLVLGLLGRKTEAIDVYRRCAQLDGAGLKDPRIHEVTKISALFNLGRMLADEGLLGQAVDVYQEAVEKMPPYYQPQSLYNMLGEAYFKQEQYERAEKWYLEALRVKPIHVPAHLTYGKLLTKVNRHSEAENWFLKAKELAPSDPSVHQHYGQFLSETERHSEAAESYLKAAELSPLEYEIIFNAANTLRQAGRNKEAERFYRSAVTLRPQDATSHLNLGAMLHVNGKFPEAEMSYLAALKLKPDDVITQANLKKLRQIFSGNTQSINR